jgi:hypothetical protein
LTAAEITAHKHRSVVCIAASSIAEQLAELISSYVRLTSLLMVDNALQNTFGCLDRLHAISLEHLASYSMGTDSMAWVKRPVCADVKNQWSYTSASHISLHGVDGIILAASTLLIRDYLWRKEL